MQSTISLREGQPWAEIDARRVGDLRIIRSVLRRTEAVRPSLAVADPKPLSSKPYSEWDPRTIWMLDFLRQDLRADDLRLDNTLMAHFIAREPEKPKASSDNVEGGDGVDDVDDASADTAQRPAVDAVRLRGSQLHDHPDACARIVEGARLRDLEVRVRRVTDATSGHSKLVRFRLSRDDDHLAVLSGAQDGKVDPLLHREVVALVRNAAGRALDEGGLEFTLRRISKLAESGAIEPDGASVFGDLDDEPRSA